MTNRETDAIWGKTDGILRRGDTREFHTAVLDLAEADLQAMRHWEKVSPPVMWLSPNMWGELLESHGPHVMRRKLGEFAHARAEAARKVAEATADEEIRIRAWSVFYGLKQLGLKCGVIEEVRP